MSEKCPNCGAECEVRRCQYLPDGGSDADDCPRFIPVSAPCPCPPGRRIGECIYCVPLPDPEVKRLRGEVATIQTALDAALIQAAKRGEAIERAKAEAERLYHARANDDRDHDVAMDEARSRIAALEEYAKHRPDCGIFRPVPRDCDCGMDTLLATPDAQGTPALADKLIPPLRQKAREMGYALAVHGSLARDIDLIAVPWTEKAVEPEVLAEALRQAAEATTGRAFLHPTEAADEHHRRGMPGFKPHGRLVWAFLLGGEPYIDLSVMPPSGPDDDMISPCDGCMGKPPAKCRFKDATPEAQGEPSRKKDPHA